MCGPIDQYGFIYLPSSFILGGCRDALETRVAEGAAKVSQAQEELQAERAQVRCLVSCLSD